MALLQLPSITERECISVANHLADLGILDRIPMPPAHGNTRLVLVKPRPKLVVVNLHGGEHQGENSLRVLMLSFPPIFVFEKLIRSGSEFHVQRMDKTWIPRFLERLERLGFEDISGQVSAVPETDYHFRPDVDRNWGNFSRRTLRKLREFGFDISKETEAILVPHEASEKNFSFEVAQGQRGWFSMSLRLSVDNINVSLLPILRSAIRRMPIISREAVEALNHNGKFVCVLEDGRVVTMPFDRIKTIILTLQELLTDEAADDDSLNISGLHAVALLNNKQVCFRTSEAAEQLRKFVESVERLSDFTSVEPSSDFQATLRSYQNEGLGWLQLISVMGLGGILADDMGLGKTVQVLANILLDKHRLAKGSPVLIVCPSSVVSNWLAEAAKFTPRLRVVSYVGQERASAVPSFEDADIVLTSYAVLTRDSRVLNLTRWLGIILDEAQVIKNPNTKLTDATKSLSAGYRLSLTGTPIENHLGELWSQFDFLMPGLLGDRRKFNQHFRKPIENGDVERREALAARIRPFLLRRTKREVLTDLPDKIEITRVVDLAPSQVDLYETVRLTCDAQLQEEIASKGMNSCQLIILDALLKLRQVCAHPSLCELEEARSIQESAKLETLLEMIQELIEEGRKILVFSQFTSMLDIISNELTSRNIGFVELRGDTKDRSTPVAQFQETNVPVFLLSLKAGGVGLNLTAADVVIHYDPWWNPAVEDQASDRAYRIGQSKNVFVYKLIARGTVEEVILDLQEQKRGISSALFESGNGFNLVVSQDHLQALLRPFGEVQDVYTISPSV